MSRLTIAIPSKGRLKDNAEAWLGRAGFKLRQSGGDRGYTAELKGLPGADVLLLSAREIAQGLIDGAFHIGVTGEDLLHDLSADIARDAAVIRRLDFGGADVVVAVPAAWLDVNTMSELEAAGARFRQRHGRRMRVATKYLRLTRNFFAEKSVGEYRLIESAGATEAESEEPAWNLASLMSRGWIKRDHQTKFFRRVWQTASISIEEKKTFFQWLYGQHQWPDLPKAPSSYPDEVFSLKVAYRLSATRRPYSSRRNRFKDRRNLSAIGG